MKIPWKKIGEVVIPVAIDQVLDTIKSRNKARPQQKSKGSVQNQIEVVSALEVRIHKLEDELEETVEALRTTSTELSKRIQEIAAASQIVTVRTTIALALSSISIVIGAVILLIDFFKH